MSKPVKKTEKKQNRGNPNLPKPGPGRPKGCQNKLTKNIKDNFETVFEKLGGIDGFYTWAKKPGNQGHFYQMYSKMLPSNVDVDHSGGIKTDSEMTIKVVKVEQLNGNNDE